MEGSLEEKKIVLGWEFDLRALTTSLPKDKYIDWTNKIEKFIKEKKSYMKDLDSIVGRSGHTA